MERLRIAGFNTKTQNEREVSVSENKSLRSALFGATMRRETVKLKNGVEVVIKQLSQAEAERLMIVYNDQSKPVGLRTATMINARCVNPDESVIFDEKDLAVFGGNVASDSPILIELMNKIAEFDKQTQRKYEEAVGN